LAGERIKKGSPGDRLFSGEKRPRAKGRRLFPEPATEQNRGKPPPPKRRGKGFSTINGKNSFLTASILIREGRKKNLLCKQGKRKGRGSIESLYLKDHKKKKKKFPFSLQKGRDTRT